MIQSKLFQRAVLQLLMIFALLAVASSLLTSWNLYRNIQFEYKEKGLAIANSIADSSVELLINADLALVQSVVDQYVNIGGVAYVYVVDDTKQIVTHTFVPAVPQPILNRLIDSEISEVTVKDYKLEQFGHVLDIAAPILGGQLGVVHIGMETSSVTHLTLEAIFVNQLFLLIIFIISFMLMYQYIHKISSRLLLLKNYAKSLSKHDYKNKLIMQQGVQKNVANDYEQDEISDLAKTFIFLENTLITHIKHLTDTTALKERIESELNIAREIQMNMLPKILPPFPNRTDLRLETYINTAKEVGGDFYDFYLNERRNRFYFSVGDVSGKGIPAALFMAVTSTLLRYTASRAVSTVDILTQVNQTLCVNNESQHFVTLFVGILDLSTGKLEYCSAGHDLPYILRNDGFFRLESNQNIALGICEDATYTHKSVQLHKKDTLLLFTDGITEAISHKKEIYGWNRFERVLKRGEFAPKQLVKLIIQDIHRFMSGAPQADDITLFALQWGKQEAGEDHADVTQQSA